MPVYVYRCEKCGSQFEKKQSFSDAPLVECELCHGHLHKVFSPAAIIYKGSGFYSTDYSSKSGSNGRNGSGERNGADHNGGADNNGSAEKNGAGEKNGGAEKSETRTAAGSKDTSKASASTSKNER